MPQVKWISDESGNTMVDFVGHFENLREDFQAVCERLGVDTSLPHVKPSDHKPYREYYSDESRKIITDVFREDLEAFDYEF